MEQGRDVNNMIENIEGGLGYLSTICFTPELHHWLLGNDTLMKILNLIPAVRRKDPFPNILSVGSCFALHGTQLTHSCRLQEARLKHMTRSKGPTPEETCCLGYVSNGLKMKNGWVTEVLSII
jgi:hypothetical protein